MRDDLARMEWIARAKRTDVLEAAQLHGARLKRHGGEWAGPCPACDGRDRFSVNTRKQVFRCRPDAGGGVIDMMMHIAGVDFLGACELLTGEPPPRAHSGIDRAEIEARRQRMRQEAEARAAARAREIAADEERRRERAWQLWNCGRGARGTVVTRYLAARGIDPYSVATRRMKLLPDAPCWHEVDGRPQVIHTGPAMMVAIQHIAGRFLGVHLTWLKADGSGKAEILAPDTGEKLPAKKFRGLAKGGAIRLTGDVPGDVLLTGEGNETTLSAYDTLRRARPDLSLAAWAAASLGNLGGGGRGCEPDMDDPGFLPPPWAKKVIILGDGDSDAGVTAQQTERCRRRCAILGIPAAVAMAAPGMDFNDMLRGL